MISKPTTIAKIFLASASVLLFAQSAMADSKKSDALPEGMQELKAYQSLPDVPNFSGQAVFNRGLISHTNGCPTITYNFEAREDQQSVLRWYQEALKNYKWTSQGANNCMLVSGEKKGNLVQVKVVPSAKRGYGSQVTISYTSSTNYSSR